MKNDLNANFDFHDDPRLTAYALGEMPSEDALAIEQQLSADEALRADVESIRATAAMLREGFAGEPTAALTSSQRDAVLREPITALGATAGVKDRHAGLNSPRNFAWRSRWIGATLAAAAVIALSVTAAIMLNPNRVMTEDYAKNQSLAPATGAVADGPQPMDRDGLAGGRGATEFFAGQEHSLRAAVPGEVRHAPSLASIQPTMESGLAGSGGGGGSGAEETLGRTKERSRQNETDAGLLSLKDLSMAPMEKAAPRPTGGAGADTRRGAPSTAAHPAPAGAASTPSSATADETRRDKSTTAGGGRKRDGEALPESDADDARQAGAPTKAASPDASAAMPSPQPSSVPTSAPTAEPNMDPKREIGGNEAGSLRQPKHGAADSAPETPAVEILGEKQIAAMDESQVKEALTRIAHARSATRLDSRVDVQLKREFTSLMSRLRVLNQQEAEEYSRIHDNPFIRPVGENALSTFAADVDTASYANVRRFLNAGELPPPDAVRIEELINYFRYDYAPPSVEDGDVPFKANVEVAAAPWNPTHRLLRIGLRGKEERLDMRRPTSLTFLIDVSGSMNQPVKLPLVKQALQLLVQQLNADDRLAVVTYAGNAGVALESCYVNADNRETVEAAINAMQPGGGTNGSGGINLAYDIARQNFIAGGINRIVLCTDGDFNVGVSGDDALVNLIEEQRKSGVFLTVLGFGKGNFKDGKMEKLANSGNGNFAYIDSVDEAKKVLVEQMGGTLITIAKDVKFQVEFNPAKVGAYRLIGYEDRLLAAQDFNNDLKDAGEVGSGHTVTALYEIVPVGEEAGALALNDDGGGEASELIFQKPAAVGGDGEAASDLLCEVRIRHKLPDADDSTLLRFAVKDEGKPLGDASNDFRFAAAVAEFGMLLRYSPYKSGATFDHAYILAESALGDDEQGYRAQFLEMIRKTQTLTSE